VTEKKPKIPLTGQVRLPEELDRAIDMEASRLGLFKYEIVQDAWQAYLAKRGEPHKSAKIASDNPIPPGVECASTNKGNTGSVELQVPPHIAPWVKRLLNILETADTETVEAITRNLSRFDLLTRILHKEAEALVEIDRLAREIATGDAGRRREVLRELADRYRIPGADALPHEDRAPKGRKA